MSDASDRILRLMESAELSYRDLSDLTGIPKSTLQRFMTGQRDIPLNKLEAIAKATGTTAQFLLGWDNITDSPARDSVPFGLSPDAVEVAQAYDALETDVEKNMVRASLGLPALKRGERKTS